MSYGDVEVSRVATMPASRDEIARTCVNNLMN